MVTVNISERSADGVEPGLPSDLLIVSHRGPVSLARDERGDLVIGKAPGGLAPSLLRAIAGTGATWIACASGPLERELTTKGVAGSLVEGVDLRFLVMDQECVKDAYETIASATIWFFHHAMTDIAISDFGVLWQQAFSNFRRYNQTFANEIVECARTGATVMVNDYHLPLVGAVLKEKRPDLKTLHFTHTPFSTPQDLERLPRDVVCELLTGMASYGACGFHTDRWAASFRDCLDHFGVPAPEIFSCPLGIDVERLRVEDSKPGVQLHAQLQQQRFSGKRVILRSDRLEPTKNIVRGFEAFAELLERHPEYRSEVVFYARAYVSRTELQQYRSYREEIEQVVKEINERFGTKQYQPVIFEVDDDYEASLAAYRRYDVLLVNPLLDGMNLVAKEAPVLNTRDGAVILSTGAGAYVQLHDLVIGIDAFDVTMTADALEEALTLSPEVRASRALLLKQRAGDLAPSQWLARCLEHAKVTG